MRHARAARVTLGLRATNGAIELSIHDDGDGFDAGAAPEPGHRGLANMQSRARAAGGELVVESAPGAGCRVLLRVPV